MAGSDTSGLRDVPIPLNETERLAALRSFNILDSDPEPVFDRFTNLACSIFDVPIALVSLVDRNRQWFKSAFGLEVRETVRHDSFCAHAILDDPVMVVPDAREDPRFARNPLVTGAPYIRFYAGAPLVTHSGFRLGTLCIIDTKERPAGLSKKETKILSDLATAVMREIELNRQTAQEFTALRKELQLADAAKERFLQLVSHELRTPLNAIIGFSELIVARSNADDQPDECAYAAHISDAGWQLLSMIDGILEWSSIERGEIRLDEQEIALSEQIDRALALLPGSDARVTLSPWPKPLRVKCDPRLVIQVLANVVDNALKHCHVDTPISLSVEFIEGKPLAIRIADEGPGIPKDRLDAAFGAFEQLGDQFIEGKGGLGLGLAISRKLMELHGGQLRLATSPESGTTAELLFPAYRCSVTEG
jgi:two-component system, sensor histidine kinase